MLGYYLVIATTVIIVLLLLTAVIVDIAAIINFGKLKLKVLWLSIDIIMFTITYVTITENIITYLREMKRLLNP